jgi:hypothetical protein
MTEAILRCESHGNRRWEGHILCEACGRVYQTKDAAKPYFAPEVCACGAIVMQRADRSGRTGVGGVSDIDEGARLDEIDAEIDRRIDRHLSRAGLAAGLSLFGLAIATLCIAVSWLPVAWIALGFTFGELYASRNHRRAARFLIECRRRNAERDLARAQRSLQRLN